MNNVIFTSRYQFLMEVKGEVFKETGCYVGALRQSSNEELTLETSALKPLTVANLRYQLS